MEEKNTYTSIACGCLWMLIIMSSLIFILPLFNHSCSDKARQAEGRQYIGSMNRAQQAYYLAKQLTPPAQQNIGLKPLLRTSPNQVDDKSISSQTT